MDTSLVNGAFSSGNGLKYVWWEAIKSTDSDLLSRGNIRQWNLCKKDYGDKKHIENITRKISAILFRYKCIEWAIIADNTTLCVNLGDISLGGCIIKILCQGPYFQTPFIHRHWPVYKAWVSNYYHIKWRDAIIKSLSMIFVRYNCSPMPSPQPNCMKATLKSDGERVDSDEGMDKLSH